VLLRDNIYEAVRADILACRMVPGEELRELELADRFEVSRAPVRDALLRLARERLVTVHPRQGYTVNRVSIADARELFAFRTLLEAACASAAAEIATTEISGSLDRFRQFGPGEDFIEYNRAFHVALAQAGGNRRMAAAACELIDQAERLIRVSIANVKGRDPAHLVAEHVALIDAVQAHDARRAGRLVRDHVGKAERRIIAALERSAIII
jgi:GntR family transcriptional regulator, rspAB operon transcriptional repressor